jgi:hypothetical protein
VNGPIIKELGFNYGQGALRVGFQANTSIGRFWRLYLRNVAGFLPHKTDKATFGGTWRVVLAENEDFLASIGWPTVGVEQGLEAGGNAVTVSSCTSIDSYSNVGAPSAEEVMQRLAARVVDVQICLFRLGFAGPGVRPSILLSPALADIIAKGGYSKDAMRKYLHRHAVFEAKRFERYFPDRRIHLQVKAGFLPASYAQSDDPNRLLPIVWSPADFLIAVSGDEGRDNCMICAQNGFMGYPVSRTIRLPSGWKEKLESEMARP